MAKSRPRVILSAAMSIDGKIATRTHHSKLSSTKDLARVHRLRKNVDAVLIGKKTVFTDNPILTVRYVQGKNPTRIILDPRANIPLTSRIVKTAKKICTMIIVTQKAPQKNIEKLEEKGANVIRCGQNRIDLKKLLRILRKRGINKILLEGGGTTNWFFLKERLIDEIIITVTPFVLGGQDAISLVEGLGFDKISKSHKFRLKEINRIKNEVILHYIS
jgi:2,5-diamino-6-(ribosylamino)-4(3H)-pyrimidinone 5'-phosphate reductase